MGTDAQRHKTKMWLQRLTNLMCGTLSESQFSPPLAFSLMHGGPMIQLHCHELGGSSQSFSQRVLTALGCVELVALQQ